MFEQVMTVITEAPTSSILEASLGFRAAKWAPAQRNIIHAGKVWKQGGELYYYYFFIVPRLITVTLNVKLSAHTCADPYQICSKSSTMLASFYSFVLFCLYAAASLLHIDGF